VRFGPSLKVDVGFDTNFVAGFGGPPKPGLKGLDALIDTGAQESYIDRTLVAELGLPLINRDAVGSALGSAVVDIHLAQVRVLALDTLILGRFAAVNLRENGIEFDALLGRTFLQNYHFSYDGPSGRATISKPEGVGC
jgi:predicted aspartyl protease